MAYDASRQRSVVFGSTGGSSNRETWEWDGTSWSHDDPATSPTSYWEHAMAYDSARQRVVLFGGEDGRSVLLADTWVRLP